MFQNVDKKVQKSAKKYECVKCNYITIYKTHFTKHLETKKHKNNTMLTKCLQKVPKSAEKWVCDCGKTYKYRQSYYRHIKSCYDNTSKTLNLNNKEDLAKLVFKLLDENKDLRNNMLKQSEQITKQNEQISELIPKVGNNNKHFNINVFLNEKCRDAISIKDFVENITITLKDLDFTKENGNVKGITNIITNHLNKLSLYKRPLHCYNKEEKILYIKNKEWEEDEDYKQMNYIIKSLESKQIKKLNNWTKENPNYMNSEDKQNEFIKLVNKTMENNPDKRKKIIKILCDKTLLTNKK